MSPVLPHAVELAMLVLLAFVLGGFVGEGARRLVPTRRPRPANVPEIAPSAAGAAASPAPVVQPQVQLIERVAPAVPETQLQTAPLAEPIPDPVPQPPADPDPLVALGIPPGDAASLRSVGIVAPEQLATWGPGHIAWVDRYLGKGPEASAAVWVERARAR